MPFRLITTKMFIAAFSAIVLFASCKKDKDNDGPAPVPEKKITAVRQDQDNYLEFVYAADGTLTRVKFAEEETPGVQTMDITYGTNKRIKSILLNDGFVVEYIYENDRLAQTQTLSGTGHIVTSGAYFYQNGNLVDYGQFLPFPLEDGSDGILYKRVNESTYVYNSDRSIRSITNRMRNPITDKMEPAGKRIYDAYDGKINPLRSLGDFAYGFLQELNPSNITKETAYDETGAIEEVIERTYTYDNHGYPLTCVEKSTVPGENPVIKTLTFTYK